MNGGMALRTMVKNRTSHEKNAAGRRGFLKSLAGSVIGSIEEIRGKPQMSLADLGQVPDDVIRIMVPVFNEFHPCRISDRHLYAINRKTGEEEMIRVLDEAEQMVFDVLDGVRTIGEISRETARRFELDEDEAYRRTKSFFIYMAQRMICLPSQAHREGADPA